MKSRTSEARQGGCLHIIKATVNRKLSHIFNDTLVLLIKELNLKIYIVCIQLLKTLEQQWANHSLLKQKKVSKFKHDCSNSSSKTQIQRHQTTCGSAQLYVQILGDIFLLFQIFQICGLTQCCSHVVYSHRNFAQVRPSEILIHKCML
jgi:hypothetical protein